MKSGIRGTPIILAAIAAAVLVSKGDSSRAQVTSASPTTHVNVTTAKSFEAVTSAIEKQLGKYDAAAVGAAFSSKLASDEVEARIQAMEGSSGFMLFVVRDHGQLLSLKGKQVSARQYEIGNPLIALQMTQADIRAGEYAPLRIYVYSGDDHLTHIDYDLPSTLLGRFHAAGVDKVARSLDEKLERLIAHALKD